MIPVKNECLICRNLWPERLLSAIKRPHNKVTHIGERADAFSFPDLLKDCYIKELDKRL